MKSLCIDIGNSVIKWAYFDQHQLLDHGTGPLSVQRSTDRRIYIASGKTPEWVTENQRMEGLQENPAVEGLYKGIGKDRMAAMQYGMEIFPEKPLLIMDAGSCLTTDIINGESQYQGGSISPGLQYRLRATHEYSARLPRVELSESFDLKGFTTSDNIRAGAFGGMVYEIEGRIRSFKEQYPAGEIIITGGDAPYFFDYIKYPIFADPLLVLRGLNSFLYI